MMRLLAILILVATTGLVTAIESQPAEASAPATLSIEYQGCDIDGTVRVSFYWAPADALWLDISETSNFQGWSNVRLTPGQGKYLWKGLKTSTTYYARVSSPGANGWLRSNTVSFTTLACNLPISPHASKDIAASNPTCIDGRAHVSFTWAIYDSYELHEYHNEWFDRSRDPNFSGWSNINVGPALTGYQNVGFEPDTTYYVRVSTYAGGGVWWTSGIVSFHTLNC